MDELPAEYMVELANQMAFVGAFLGGFSATFLGTVLAIKEKPKFSATVVVALSFAASMFIVSVLTLTGLAVVNHPDAGIAQEALSSRGRILGFGTFMLGMYALLTGIGFSGFLYSRRVGLVTLIIGSASAVLITWLITGV